MKKIDTVKYISIGSSVLALVFVFLGFPIVAGPIAAAALLVPFFIPHKSGGIFTFTFFAAAVALGFSVDYPFRVFPVSLVSLLLLVFIFNLRNFFYRQLLVSRFPWLEAAGTTVVTIFLIVSAYLVHYDLRQWLTAAPVFFFWIASFNIYKDRKAVQVTIENKRPELKVGTPAPNFTLPDQNGNLVSLADLLKSNHALLIFVRGDWCPTCHMMLRSYFRNKEKFAEKNVRVVGIGPDPQGVNKEIMQRIDEHSLLLSDDSLDTAQLYTSGLQPSNLLTKTVFEKGAPLPASFLVHQNGNIVFASRSDQVGEILQPELIFEVLETFA